MAHAGDEHFGGVLEVVEDVDDLADQAHAGRADVVEPADERADVAGADLGGEPRLRRREDQRDVDTLPLGRQRLAGACTPSFVNGTLTTMCSSMAARSRPSRIIPAVIGGDHLGADRALHGLADLLEDRARIARFLRHQRRVGGDAVEDADRGERLDLLQVAGVDKQLHRRTPSVKWGAGPCPAGHAASVQRAVSSTRAGALTFASGSRLSTATTS